MAGPLPVILPAGGTIAAASGLLSKPDAGHAVERRRIG